MIRNVSLFLTGMLHLKIRLLIQTCEESVFCSIVEESVKEENLRIFHLKTNYVAHNWLFPKCYSILHHGGSGTVASAVIAGKPQLVLPFIFDQMYWGDRVEWMGVGVNLGRLR